MNNLFFNFKRTNKIIISVRGLTMYCALRFIHTSTTVMLLHIYVFCQLPLILLKVGERETLVISSIMFLAAKQMDDLISL